MKHSVALTCAGSPLFSSRVVNGECVLRYDNEAGKGGHRHVRDREHEHRFKSAEQLLADFWSDVEGMLK